MRQVVSIPSQVGTLFGHGWRTGRGCPHRGLNTLSGGHPLRTYAADDADDAPAGLNTLSGGHPLRTFDQDDWFYGAAVSQYPLRWAPSSDKKPCRTSAWRTRGLNTLSGGHPLRTTGSMVPPSTESSLNTLSGGHPLRTAGLASPCKHWRVSLNTLSGGHPLRTARPAIGPSRIRVSIPSQVGTLFGRSASSRPPPRNPVSIPSQVGTLFGP